MSPPRPLSRIPRNRLALAAGLVIAAAGLAALLAPLLPLLDPDVVDTPNRLRPPGSPGHLPAPPAGRAFVLGRMLALTRA